VRAVSTVVAAILTVLASGDSARTQPQPTTPLEGLTVVAPPTEQDRLPDLVDRFVASHSATGRYDLLSRWARAVCPQAAGLTPPLNAFVAAQVRTVARRVGAPVEKHPRPDRPCQTNVLVIFTPEPQALMDRVRARHPELLGFHYAAQAERLSRVTAPIQAWYVTGGQGSSGEVILDDPQGDSASGGAGSRLTAYLSSRFLAVLVVVDAGRIVGRPIGAIADGVAMRALARARVAAGCDELPTILDALNADCPQAPNALSAYDVAYLKALYAVNPETFAKAQESDIRDRVLREVRAAR
jgi:hypothetical protein